MRRRPSATCSPRDGDVSPPAWGWTVVRRRRPAWPHACSATVQTGVCRQPSGVSIRGRLAPDVLGAGRPLSSAAGVVAVGIDKLPHATPSWNWRPCRSKSMADRLVVSRHRRFHLPALAHCRCLPSSGSLSLLFQSTDVHHSLGRFTHPRSDAQT